MFKIGKGAKWEGGQFFKPVELIKADGLAYATKFDVVFPGNFGSFALDAAAAEVAAWDGATEGKFIKMAEWAKERDRQDAIACMASEPDNGDRFF